MVGSAGSRRAARAAARRSCPGQENSNRSHPLALGQGLCPWRPPACKAASATANQIRPHHKQPFWIPFTGIQLPILLARCGVPEPPPISRSPGQAPNVSPPPLLLLGELTYERHVLFPLPGPLRPTSTCSQLLSPWILV
jgi:hypothetical protein